MAKQNAEDPGGPQHGPATIQHAPATVRWAGALAALEGVVGLVVAIVLVIQAATGTDRASVRGPGAAAQPYGTAAWFAILSLAVLAAGVSLIRSRRWGRAIVVIAQILLLPASWYMFRADRLDLAIPVAITAVVTLGLTFAPASVQWMARVYETAE